MSQRALSKLAGVPQGHISKIENGSVDLRLSSLVELARVLGLELALVPRRSLAAVQSVARSAEGRNLSHGAFPPGADIELKRLQASVRALIREHPHSREPARIARQLHDLQHLPLDAGDVEVLRAASTALSSLEAADGGAQLIRQILGSLQDLRSRIVHSRTGQGALDRLRPA